MAGDVLQTGGILAIALAALELAKFALGRRQAGRVAQAQGESLAEREARITKIFHEALRDIHAKVDKTHEMVNSLQIGWGHQWHQAEEELKAIMQKLESRGRR